MGLYDRLLGTPWVYERLRLAILGGGPARRVVGWLGDTREDVLIDVGCGPGLSLDLLAGFRAYHGFDTDARALRRFRQKHPPGNVYLYNAPLTVADLETIAPTTAILMGILHHLSDIKAAELLAMLAGQPSLKCAITLDPVLVPGKTINNVLCRLDRGAHVRTREQYLALIEQAGLHAERSEILTSGNGLASYFCTLLLSSCERKK